MLKSFELKKKGTIKLRSSRFKSLNSSEICLKMTLCKDDEKRIENHGQENINGKSLQW